MVSRWPDMRWPESTNISCEIFILEEFLASPASPDSIERIARLGGFINLNIDTQSRILESLQANPAALKAMMFVFAEFATPNLCVSRPGLVDKHVQHNLGECN